MKLLVGISLLLIATVAFAQNYQGMGNVDMQEMMEQMQKMQACMENIDQAKMRKLEQRSYQIGEEIEALCNEGKRDEAEKKALAYGMEIINDPTMKKLNKCRENIKINMPNMPKMPYMENEKDDSRGHVCD